MKWVLLVAIVATLVRNTEQAQKADNSQNELEDELFEIEEIEALLAAINEVEREEEDEYSNQDNLESFLNKYDVDLREVNNKVAEASFGYLTNLTEENGKQYEEEVNNADTWLHTQHEEAGSYLEYGDEFDNTTAVYMLQRIVYGELPSSSNPDVISETNRISTKLEGIYGNAKVDINGKEVSLDPEITEIMATSRDYDELLQAWKGWHDVTGPKMREDFIEMIAFMNEAATEQDYNNMGEAWRMQDFMEVDLEPQIDNLMKDLMPLYQQLHAYIRRKLIEEFPDRDIKDDGPIPAHLLGNMWAQEWDTLAKQKRYLPSPDTDSFDITSALLEKGFTADDIFKRAEEFFVSIGLDLMTSTFWDKSMITKPKDRPVQCHAAAEDFYSDDDYRIKMCAAITGEDFYTVHHEMGHIEYFMQYSHQPTVFRTGANAAFHEAVGDTIALSVQTTGHLKKIGILPSNVDVPSGDDEINDSDLNFLMKIALQKIAFLPFGLLIDEWRWKVFSGEIDTQEMNKEWWKLRLKYQGVEPPVPRTEEDFDPGAKYHVAASVPYIRYFFSFVAQFQFHKALCDKSGHTGPLHRCDIYRSKDAGELLKSALSLGASKPWPDVMEILTSQRAFSAEPLLEYFKPLREWLEKQNEDEKVGWT